MRILTNLQTSVTTATTTQPGGQTGAAQVAGADDKGEDHLDDLLGM